LRTSSSFDSEGPAGMNVYLTQAGTLRDFAPHPAGFIWRTLC
jgi:hypothetical protein